MEQRIETPVSVYLGDIDITDGAATLDIVDDGPVEMVILSGSAPLAGCASDSRADAVDRAAPTGPTDERNPPLSSTP